jgi:hypothetical protein
MCVEIESSGEVSEPRAATADASVQSINHNGDKAAGLEVSLDQALIVTQFYLEPTVSPEESSSERNHKAQ